MLVTKINPEVLRAAIKRKGTWYVLASNGMPTHFIHNNCLRNLSAAAILILVSGGSIV